jgi:hypothetical protein
MREQVIRVPQIAEAWVQRWLDLNKAASVDVVRQMLAYLDPLPHPPKLSH